MPFEQYEIINIHSAGLALIDHINGIIAEYEAAGYTLTLRQIYYQLVSRDIIENGLKSYKRIGNLAKNGRLAGLIDWDAIEDRTRKHRALPHWASPAEIVRDAAKQYRRDLWEGQDRYCEVWVEKDALIGIVEQASASLDCSCFSCRGFSSLSAMWEAAQRFIEKTKQGKECVIIHLGDHDPSGVEMTNDIKKHLKLFGADVYVNRIALNMQQIEEYNPPPNLAKETDTRFKKYKAKHGTLSWELDALKPEVLDSIITGAIKSNLDQKLYNEAIEQQEMEVEKIYSLLPELDF